MPELPEVETIARGVDERLRGDRIIQAWFSRHPRLFKTPAKNQSEGLAGRTLLGAHRTGKHIVCELGSASGPGAGEQTQGFSDSSAIFGIKPEANDKTDHRMGSPSA